MISTGFRTLVYKETLRFWKVATQTVAAPVLTSMLYLLVFGHVLDGAWAGRRQIHGIYVTAGMMSVRQKRRNSRPPDPSKITGKLVFVLIRPVAWKSWRMCCFLARGMAVLAC